MNVLTGTKYLNQIESQSLAVQMYTSVHLPTYDAYAQQNYAKSGSSVLVCLKECASRNLIK